MKYFEDVEVGDTEEFGEYRVTQAEIIEFAEQYDPQPFHTDPEAAVDTPFGELVASGWHTAAMCIRMLVTRPGEEQATMGARGADELRWHQPVTPGDTLHLRTEVLEKYVSESDPSRGYFDLQIEGVNQDDDVVISWIALSMIEVRNPAE